LAAASPPPPPPPSASAWWPWMRVFSPSSALSSSPAGLECRPSTPSPPSKTAFSSPRIFFLAGNGKEGSFQNVRMGKTPSSSSSSFVLWKLRLSNCVEKRKIALSSRALFFPLFLSLSLSERSFSSFSAEKSFLENVARGPPRRKKSPFLSIHSKSSLLHPTNPLSLCSHATQGMEWKGMESNSNELSKYAPLLLWESLPHILFTHTQLLMRSHFPPEKTQMARKTAVCAGLPLPTQARIIFVSMASISQRR